MSDQRCDCDLPAFVGCSIHPGEVEPAPPWRELLVRLLPFQYEHRGMGTYACRSCGAHAYIDDERVVERREPCSPTCPWELARQAVEAQQ